MRNRNDYLHFHFIRTHGAKRCRIGLALIKIKYNVYIK